MQRVHDPEGATGAWYDCSGERSGEQHGESRAIAVVAAIDLQFAADLRGKEETSFIPRPLQAVGSKPSGRPAPSLRTAHATLRPCWMPVRFTRRVLRRLPTRGQIMRNCVEDRLLLYLASKGAQHEQND